jgi:hypothetical protein
MPDAGVPGMCVGKVFEELGRERVNQSDHEKYRGNNLDKEW